MNTSRPPAADSLHAFTDEVRTHRKRFLALGIVLFVLGLAAILFPFFATLTVTLLIGWVLVISGIAGVLHAFAIRQWRGFLFSLLGSLLSLAVGVVVLFYPLTGVLSLTLLIAAFFLASGALRALLALRLRPADHWGWLLASGLLAILLGGLILWQWPQTAGWVVGLLVGIDLAFAGASAIRLSLAARHGAPAR